MATPQASKLISIALAALLGAVAVFGLVLAYPFTSESNSHAGSTRTVDSWQMTICDSGGTELSGLSRTVHTPLDLHQVEPGWTVTLDSDESIEPSSALYVSTQYAPFRLFVNGALQESCGQSESRPAFLSDPAPSNAVVLLPSSESTVRISMEYTVPKNCWGLRAFSAQIGSPDAMRIWLASHMGFTSSFGEAIIALGLVLVLFGALVRRLEISSEIFIWLGLFCVFMGMWSIGECDLSSVLIKRPTLLHIMTYVGLYCLPVPLAHLTRIVIGHPDSWWSTLPCRATELFALAAIAMQLLGIWQFSQSVFAYYAISIFAFGLMTTGLIVSLLRARQPRSPFSICYTVMLLTLDLLLALELANYYYLHIAPEMFFSEIGAILFVTVLIVSGGVYLKTILGERLRTQEVEHKMDLLSKRVEAERKQVRTIVEASDEMRRQRHDFKHQLAVIREYNEAGDRDGLDAYLSEIGVAIPSETTAARLCENFVINAVASYYYLRLARENGIDRIDIKLDIPRDLDADLENDLAGIVGNLLENGVCAAAEVCKSSPNGAHEAFLTLRARTANGIVTITQDNSYGHVESDGHGSFLSTNSHGGISLQSIRETARARQGNARFEAHDGVFFSSVYLRLVVDRSRGNEQHSLDAP